MKKLTNNRGETLIESLVALLVVTMTFAFLATAASTAARLNAKVRDTDISFRYDPADSASATLNVESTALAGKKSGSQGVTLYTYNDYLYYEGGTTGGTP